MGEHDDVGLSPDDRLAQSNVRVQHQVLNDLGQLGPQGAQVIGEENCGLKPGVTRCVERRHGFDGNIDIALFACIRIVSVVEFWRILVLPTIGDAISISISIGDRFSS